MRLAAEDTTSIIQAIETSIPTKSVKLYLYGSRTNETLKGGDIDLLLVFTDDVDYSVAVEKKYDLLVKIKENIGEQKVDLLLVKEKDLTQDSFLKLIFPDSKLLKIW